jgi:ketosteroid isomerase-like protein
MDEDWTQIAVDVQTEWKRAFEAREFDKLAALYAENTAFYGSTRAFYSTPAGVREYFRVLPPHFVRADYARPHIVRLGDNAMAATGQVLFYTLDDGTLTERPFRMTHVLVRENGTWKIATHHASPRPPT